MKKLMLVSLLCLIAGFVMAEPPQSIVVSNNSVVVMPQNGTINATAFNTNYTAYTAGTYVSSPAGYIYLVTVAGNGWTNPPTHIHGSATNGTTSMYRVMPKKRNGYSVSCSTTGGLWVAINNTAVTNTGLQVAGSTSIDSKGYSDAVILHEIQAVSVNGTTNTVTFQEW